MIQLDSTKETRLLIAHFSGTRILEHAQVQNLDGSLLSLRHPKSGHPTCYAFINESLQELHWFKQSYGSWFQGNYVCEDGGLYTASPVDPVFILLPVFEEARMKKENDHGKFRKLDEIMFIDGYPGYQDLLPIAEDCMRVVCEVKVIDAVALLGEYLKDDPWFHLLCNHLRLDIQKVARKTTSSDIPISLQNTMEPTHSLQMKNQKEKNVLSTRRQPRRMKTETASLSIKDMFCKVSRQGT
ncbi:uncharacterized protein LOC131246088 isoform X2 [Magnolia sinica]|uniref:uncharacterized protein LOC131246088 isoform X2 n=1 Tax=Magnolia sinica TaxID=86752 RepID=UPI0026590699|nr:uncharacterized protein LOC131246088 isoform X2 [Magnolia sinica]